MGPGIGEEVDVFFGRDFFGERAGEPDAFVCCERAADESEGDCGYCHCAEQDCNRAKQGVGCELGLVAGAGGESDEDAEYAAHPGGCANSPGEGEHGWGLGFDDFGVGDGEVFNADSRGDLVVDDSVDAGGEDTEKDNSEELHGGGYCEVLELSRVHITVTVASLIACIRRAVSLAGSRNQSKDQMR